MNTEKFNAIDIANYIVWRAKAMNINNVTHLKLQKLLYYVLAKFFKEKRERLIDEDIYKWQYGPVVKSVYHQFKLYGNNNITEPSAYLDPSSNYLEGSGKFFIKFVDVDSINERINRTNIKDVVDSVLCELGSKKPFDLVRQTHQESAWKDYENEILSGCELAYSDQELLSAKI